MDVYLLYLCLKQILLSIDSQYSVSFNDMDSNGKNVIGIYIKGSTPSQYRTLKDGKYINKTARVQVLGQSKDDYTSLLLLMCFYTQLEDLVSELGGFIYNISPLRDDILKNFDEKNIRDITILRTDIITSSSYIGKNEQGLPMFDLNFDIEYGITYNDKDDV